MEHALEHGTPVPSRQQARGKSNAPDGTRHPALELQQQAGNLAVQSLLRAGAIQARLTVSQPDDPDEREADAVAEQITGRPAVFAAAQCACQGSGEPCDKCGSAASVQRKASGGAASNATAPKAVERILHSSGRPLDSSARAFFEPRFGRNLSDVRVHTGREAQDSTRSIQARAFTAGEHIVFNSGEYAPESEGGRRLLAHELAHVVQQSRPDGKVRRQFFFQPFDSNEEIPPEDLYDRVFAWVGTMGVDQCAEIMARQLAKYVASHPNPYAYITTAFDHTRSKHEDNVAAAFVALLAEDQLDRFAATEQGRSVLDMLYEAMMTGDVSPFERTQSARIDQYGLPGALKRQAPWMWIGLADSSPEELVKHLKRMALADVDTAAEFTARKLRAMIDHRPDPIAFLVEVFHRIPDEYEDNVAAEFMALVDNSRLQQFASTDDGRKLLDILYDALITGSVSDFQRYESERIANAKRARISVSDYEKYEAHPLIFPFQPMGFVSTFFHDCYTGLVARLEDGKVRAWYSTVRVWQCKKYAKDLATLPGSVTGSGMLLDPDQMVSVRLYDEGGKLIHMTAIELIDYSNKDKRQTVSFGAKAFMLGLTLPLAPGEAAAEGADVALEEAGTAAADVAAEQSAANLARLLAIGDRVAWVLQTLTDLIDANREWIAELPGGEIFLDAVDAVSKVVEFYGMARMGYDGLHFASGKLRQASNSPLTSLDHAEEAADINRYVKGLQTDLDRAEQEAARATQSGANARMGGGAPQASGGGIPEAGPPAGVPAAHPPTNVTLPDVHTPSTAGAPAAHPPTNVTPPDVHTPSPAGAPTAHPPANVAPPDVHTPSPAGAPAAHPSATPPPDVAVQQPAHGATAAPGSHPHGDEPAGSGPGQEPAPPADVEPGKDRPAGREVKEARKTVADLQGAASNARDTVTKVEAKVAEARARLAKAKDEVARLDEVERKTLQDMRKMPGARGKQGAKDLQEMQAELDANLKSARAKAAAADKEVNAAQKELEGARNSLETVESQAELAGNASARLDELIKRRNEAVYKKGQMIVKGQPVPYQFDRDLEELENEIERVRASLRPGWFKRLRSGTPGPGAVEKAVANTEALAPELRVEGTSDFKDVTNPEGPLVKHEDVSPDHIYPFEKVIREPGFLKLTPAQQKELLENPDNYFVLSEAANSSKGARSMQEWFQTPMGSQIPLDVRRKLLAAEEKAIDSVRSYIKARVTP